MFWTRKTVPLNVFSWKFLKSWRNSGDVEGERPRAEYFAPSSKALIDLGIELEIADQRLGAAGTTRTAAIGDLSAERSRLKPPAL